MRIEEFDSPNGGGFCRARASLGVIAFGIQVENFPPHFEHFPEYDHTADGQEEVYTVLSGSATLHADGESYELEPGVFARVGPSVTRKITTGDEPIQLLAIGATPGRPYTPAAVHGAGRAVPAEPRSFDQRSLSCSSSSAIRSTRCSSRASSASRPSASFWSVVGRSNQAGARPPPP